jgi:acetolactate decarboxylase
MVKVMQKTVLAAIGIVFVTGVFTGLLVAGSIMAPRVPAPDKDELYSVSTINALALGVYSGVMPVSELGNHGDLGIGTFDALDGELIMLDGGTWQVRSDGIPRRTDANLTTPWAVMTWFEPDIIIPVNGTTDLSGLTGLLDEALPSENLFYAVRIDGVFPAVRVRAPFRQEKPYPPLVNATANQAVFNLSNTTGTIIGFYSPDYSSGLSVPGYHFHYIAKDRGSGGHVIGLTLGPGEVRADVTSRFAMVLPESGDFIGVDLSRDLGNEIAHVESGK